MTNRKLIDKEKFAIDIIANTLQMAQIFYNASPSLIFEPKNNLKHLAKHLNQILQYLIHTYASRSNDCSTETSIASAAICYEWDYNDLLSLDKNRATSMLREHLTWKNLHFNNLISRTSFFLFAVQHEVYRNATDRDRSKLLNIWICILNTRKFPQGFFMKTMALLKAYDISNFDNIKHNAYHDKYLSQCMLEV